MCGGGGNTSAQPPAGNATSDPYGTNLLGCGGGGGGEGLTSGVTTTNITGGRVGNGGKIKRPESVKSELHVFTKGGRRLDSDAEISELEADLILNERNEERW